MPSIRKRAGKWQVQVRKNGEKTLSRTFTRKQDAERWARETEYRIERGLFDRPPQDLNSTLADVLARYISEVASKLRSNEILKHKAALIAREPIADIAAHKLRPQDIALFRDERLRSVSSETVRQDLVLIRSALETARREWGIEIASNPVDQVKKPKAGRARTRRLETDEWIRLAQALARARNRTALMAAKFALATAMRRGEILALKWGDVDLDKRTAHLAITKNGNSRTVPLSSQALAILRDMPPPHQQSQRVFQITANALRLAWSRGKKAAGVSDLRFHDLRHEAVSRFFEMGLSVPEVALISGHKDPRMLFRYTHLRAEDLVRRLSSLDSEDQS